jgi:hypothetical protein
MSEQTSPFSRPRPKLPSAPIVERIDSRGGIDAVVTDRFDYREKQSIKSRYYKIRQTGEVTSVTADWLCTFLLRVNPALVYGQAWWDSIEEPDEKAAAWLEEAS